MRVVVATVNHTRFLVLRTESLPPLIVLDTRHCTPSIELVPPVHHLLKRLLITRLGVRLVLLTYNVTISRVVISKREKVCLCVEARVGLWLVGLGLDTLVAGVGAWCTRVFRHDGSYFSTLFSVLAVSLVPLSIEKLGVFSILLRLNHSLRIWRILSRFPTV